MTTNPKDTYITYLASRLAAAEAEVIDMTRLRDHFKTCWNVQLARANEAEAENTRLKRQVETLAAEIARLVAELAESEAAAEGAFMILAQTQAERDAQIARLTAELFEMTRSRDEWRNDFRALEKTIVGDTGLSAMTVAVQARLFRPRAEKAEAERDAALAQVARLHQHIHEASDPDFLWSAMDNVNDMDTGLTEFANAASQAIRESIPDPSVLSRRDAQMRAEGLRRALDVVSENADWPEDEHGRTEHPALFARISHAILAAAEKEASP